MPISHEDFVNFNNRYNKACRVLHLQADLAITLHRLHILSYYSFSGLMCDIEDIQNEVITVWQQVKDEYYNSSQ